MEVGVHRAILCIVMSSKMVSRDVDYLSPIRIGNSANAQHARLFHVRHKAMRPGPACQTIEIRRILSRESFRYGYSPLVSSPSSSCFPSCKSSRRQTIPEPVQERGRNFTLVGWFDRDCPTAVKPIRLETVLGIFRINWHCAS
jgi:hypothetical protein